MTDGRTEAAAKAQFEDQSPYRWDDAHLSDDIRETWRQDAAVALMAADAWDREHRCVHRVQLDPDDVEVDAETALDAALGRCQVMLQCHRETGHDGGHEARETLDTGRIPDMDRAAKEGE